MNSTQQNKILARESTHSIIVGGNNSLRKYRISDLELTGISPKGVR